MRPDDTKRKTDIMRKENKWKLILILSMIIFGTLALSTKAVENDIQTGLLCMLRGFGGAVFVLLFRLITGHKPAFRGMGTKSLLLLMFSGLLLGINWAMLFMSYRYIDVGIGSLINYMAPMIVILVSPFLFKEKLSWKKMLCVLLALFGLLLVSGLLTGGIRFKEGQNPGLGFLYGTIGMSCYVSMFIINKKIKGVDGFDRAIIQLFFAGIVMIPYIFIAEGGFKAVNLAPHVLVLVPVIVLVQTGLVYSLYYGAIEQVKAQTTSIFAYIDPVMTVTLGILVLHEAPDLSKIIGAVLIVGAAVMSEFADGIGRKKKEIRADAG